ncbi:hypothetical protein NSMM_490040 [Nitrosomonas mobilis]|uniref:Uncharacterized protein n=1 Tax=Nitrosomonas mobilis TaxID=51642 RepID=A0A1G5SHX2_9PROT|nr:hypothetical protein NSMM_490040 [Nitrosomonas mobilis]
MLKLDLYPDRYAWAFLPVSEESLLDAGTGSCAGSTRNVPEGEGGSGPVTGKAKVFTIG